VARIRPPELGADDGRAAAEAARRDAVAQAEAAAHTAGPLTDKAVAVIFLGLAVLLVLGYLFVSKLMDISQEEDCMLAHRRDCAGAGVPLER
jgi:type VI protein secretion system component VasF